MLAHSYLIIGPHGPSDTQAAAITQRHTIPLAWALLAGAEAARFVDNGENERYFALNARQGVAILDEGIASWSYNDYFRSTLAPVQVFRDWLAGFEPETAIYINVSELMRISLTPEQDIASLSKLGSKVREAIENIEEMEFTHFINDLRALAHPFITVPITGDRKRDAFILTFEVRDTGSVETEMALQIVGHDRGKVLLRKAAASVPKLVPEGTDGGEELPETSPVLATKKHGRHDDSFTVVYAASDADLATLFVEKLGMTLERETPRFCFFEHDGERLKVVKLTKPIVGEVEARVEQT